MNCATGNQLPPHLRAFLDADLYPHPAADIEMLQTHISWVFLAGEYAYKVKKPVDFGFLDFSTLEARKHFCQRELELNRRLAPELYLDVLTVTSEEGRLRLNKPGEIIDYCLRMRRFDQADLFDRRLAEGRFEPRWMDDLASQVARFHESAEVCRNGEAGTPGQLIDHIEANLKVAKAHPSAIGRQTLAALESFAKSEFGRCRELLERRQQQGFIRDCHGDLHMRNITLVDGAPRIFDCIEFNDEYRRIDTLNDAAFLLMDCDAHGRPDLGLRFLSRYLEQTGDYAGLDLLNLYLFYRAGVRGKVACMLADELEDGAEKEAQLIEAKRYFELAESYTRSNKPKLFAVGGLSGSGKSRLALLGCGVERAVIIRTDATRKRIAPNYPDLELYGKPMHEITYAAMFAAGRQCLENGWSVILDATFLHPDSRRQAKELADACGLELNFYWLDVEADTLRQRVIGRKKKGIDISDADLSVLEMQLSHYERPAEPYIRFLPSAESWPG